MLRCVLGALGGLLYSLLMLFVAILLCFGGDGWNGPVLYMTGVLAMPLTGIALLTRNPLSRRRVAAVVVLLMVITDFFFLFGMIISDHWQELARVWSNFPDIVSRGLVVVWVLMWSAWHFAVIRIVCTAKKELKQEGS
jgi:hypothetical protein